MIGEGLYSRNHTTISIESSDSFEVAEACCCNRLISCLDNSFDSLAGVAGLIVECWNRCFEFYACSLFGFNNHEEN